MAERGTERLEESVYCAHTSEIVVSKELESHPRAETEKGVSKCVSDVADGSVGFGGGGGGGACAGMSGAWSSAGIEF